MPSAKKIYKPKKLLFGEYTPWNELCGCCDENDQLEEVGSVTRDVEGGQEFCGWDKRESGKQCYHKIEFLSFCYCKWFVNYCFMILKQIGTSASQYQRKVHVTKEEDSQFTSEFLLYQSER